MAVNMDNSGVTPLIVPGFGAPIDVDVAGFDHGIDDFSGTRLTVREVDMLKFMDNITDKFEWDIKLFDDTIVDKWRTEIAGQPQAGISPNTFNYCIEELRDKASQFKTTGFVKTLDSQSPCAKSDTLIDPGLKQQLVDLCKPLQEASDKDWHPKSNGQVLNLVHPSLFSLVYGTSRVIETDQVGLKNCLSSCGKGEIAAADQEIGEKKVNHGVRYGQNPADPSLFWSKRFQWLPCEVKFESDSGTNVRISSYVNNLHPIKHEALYHVLERIISTSIPLWNEVLLKSGDTYPPLRIVTNIAEFEPKFPDWEHDVALACVPERAHESSLTYEEAVDKVYEYVQQDDAEGYESSDDEYAEEQAEECGDVIGSKKWCEAMHLPSAVEWKHKRMRVVCHPEPHDYISWKAKVDECSKRTKLEQDWRSAGLQVIVKLSSIELTPEKSQYKGGSWHLEGMMNEHIVATAIYYYDCKNVTESRLAYRMHAELDELDLQYEQDDHQPLCDLFGTDSMRDEPALQELGSIATPEGRLLVFPNTLQHQVQPFQLVDKQKPGHRRFLVLWLVDPHYRITSTANVPPQQHEWWADETLMKVVDNSKLPAEISKMIMDEATDYPMSLEEAKRLRLELMSERTSFGEAVQAAVETYNLCEH